MTKLCQNLAKYANYVHIIHCRCYVNAYNVGEYPQLHWVVRLLRRGLPRTSVLSVDDVATST